MSAQPKRPFGMDEPADVTDAEFVRAKKGLLAFGVGLGVVTALVYIVPSLAVYVPWRFGEPTPIARLYEREAEQPGTVDEPQLHQVAPPVLQTREASVSTEEYAGITTHLVDSHALETFFRSLAATAAARANGATEGPLTRIAYFGDSSIALDGITQTLRQRMQSRWGNGGHGFVLAARGSMPYRHRDVLHESTGRWRVNDITHNSLSDGHYGLGGAQARASIGPSGFVATADRGEFGRDVSRFDVLFQRHPAGGLLRYRLDSGTWTTSNTRGELSDEALSIPTSLGAHRLDYAAAGQGELRLYGIVLETSGPGVVVDSLGMVGARAARMRNFDAGHLSRQLELRNANLMVIGFGGNDADDQRRIEDFERDFRDIARVARQARPEAACLMVTPLDQAERNERGVIATMPMVPRLVEAIRRAAASEGCAFFDVFAAMGGSGSMSRWFRRSPRLASGDFRHATPRGYEVIGDLLYRAVMEGFAQHLDAQNSTRDRQRGDAGPG